ncbi:DUF58 domain-containing protein [Halomonas beimenensis]|uniref:Uncharacterized protein n=1 Tax=Halomonas beimenensis TaxID=475662 RepID=A0A291P3K4_9GAMM|nr:DUF58 domain-containing protein [Halomonas beimenensis]ATJ81464.1 hypothetical protein BEI_0477 [Halomonas beimenensis]
MKAPAPEAWRERLRRRWYRRLASPLGEALPQRRLFLLPTRFGLGWAALVPLLLLLGINYQNSLVHALAFWLFALGVVGLFRAWRNLLGVRLTLRRPAEIFAGGEARLGVVAHARRPRTALRVRCGGRSVQLDVRDGQGEAELPLPAPARGVLAVPTLGLESRWPLGLVRALAWQSHDIALLVWPHPVAEPAADHRPGGTGLDSGDFAGLRRFTPGDSPARLAWKQWSRTGTLATKAFEAPPRENLWLDYDACQGDPERRLSVLCGRVLAHHRAGDRYGLRLPDQLLAPGEGESHRRAALDALARCRPTERRRR